MRDDEMIRELAAETKPVYGLKGSQWELLLWMVLTFVILLPVIVGLSIRRDVLRMLESSSYPFALFAALSLGIVAAGSALHIRIPGAKAAKRVLTAFLLIWVAANLSHGLQWGAEDTFVWSEAFGCIGLLLLFSIGPGLVLYGLVRRGRCTEPSLAFALTAVAMIASAAAFLPLVCKNDATLHLIFSHVLPIFPVSLLFWKLGPLALKW